MKKQLIQTFRDPRMLTLLLLAPILQVLIFGYAVNLDLTAQPAVIADLDRTPVSRKAVEGRYRQPPERAFEFSLFDHQAKRVLVKPVKLPTHSI